MTEQSKLDLIDAGLNQNKAFAYWVVFPKPSINGKHPSDGVLSFARYNASTDVASQSDTSCTATDTAVQINAYPLSSASATTLIIGFTYNWIVIPFE